MQFRLTAGPHAPLDSLFDAVRLRTGGVAFCAEFLLSDPRAALARNLAPSILQHFADHDERLAAFDALAAGNLKIGEMGQNQLSVYAPAVIQTLKDVAKLCEAVAVRSSIEYERVTRHLAHRPPPMYEEPRADEHVPPCEGAREAVVIWAPHLPAADTALLAFALEELHAPVAVVCREGSVPGVRARFVRAAEGTAALRNASVVVDATLDHAGNALELARNGFTVCAATSSGACEQLYGVLEYEAWNHRSVFSAVCTALGSKPAQLMPASMPTCEAPRWLEDGPLVSVIVRTYNRPKFLERALASLAGQTYRNLEIVVVNDGGVDVSQIVGRVPNARYVGQDRNRGTSAAANAGLAAATGTYVCLLDDDDIVFPEHISVLVTALLESGDSIAHTDTISAHFEAMPDGEYRTAGYAIFLDGLVEPTDFYVTDSIGPMSVLMKRSVVLAAGGFDESLTHAEDWELFLKLSQIYDFVHVPRVTAMYSIRHDGTHMMSNAGPAIAASMERLIELHPLPHRPVMEAARRATLDKYRQSGFAMRFPEPALKRE